MAYTTIDNPELYFQTLIWSGNDVGTSRAFTFDGSEDMEPDLVWTKIRTGWAAKHNLWDSVRGVNKNISSDATTAETTTDQYGYVSSFDSDGFTGSNGSNVYNPRYLYNENGGTYVAWCWKAGTAFSNDASATSVGTIDSSGSVSTDAGFSITTLTGTGANGTIAHGLSAVPAMIIHKEISADGDNWHTYHHKITSEPETEFVRLNQDAATGDESTMWNDTAPTSSVYSLGTHGGNNESGQTYISYLFAPKQGFSKFGSYSSNGSTDGVFCFCGFRPAWVMFKKTSSTANWSIRDNKRDPFNAGDTNLFANLTDAESSSNDIDFLSNGFKLRTAGSNWNASSQTYIYMAFAEAPFVNSNGVPCNAR